MKPLLLKAYLLCLISALISTGKAQVLTMNPGCHLVVNGTSSLVMNSAAIKNNGTFIPGSGTVIFTGYSDTTISYISGDSATILNNFTINKAAYGVAVKGSVGVTNTLTMSAGNLYPNSKLTLKSTEANTARVAPVPTHCTIAGKAYVERYFPAYRAWRMVTAPLTNTGTIYNSWQNSSVYQIGKGTLITGPNPMPSNGFDTSPKNNYSMYVFNKTSQQFAGATDGTKGNLSQGTSGNADNTGYMLFVRGDRNPANLDVNNQNATTISALGNLQTGTQIFTANSISGKFTLIGNPYASPIDFGTLSRTNLLNRCYVWDPYLNTVGGFVLFDDYLNTGTYTKSIAPSRQTTIIQSGQAFFVQTNANGTAALTINESNKATTNNTLAFRPASDPTHNMWISLYLLNSDSTIKIADGALAQFNPAFSDSITWEDAPKMGNINEGLGLSKYGKTLSIERNPLITTTDTLFLQLTQTTMRSYQLELVGQNFASGLTGYLQDTYLNTSTPVALADTTKINFTLSTPASAVANRFRIVFKVDNPLGVTFTSVKAVKKNTTVNVEWNVQDELDIKQYELEKSSDGINYTLAYTTAATGNNKSSVHYIWQDTNPFAGNTYYRIKSIDKNGTIQFSQTVSVTMDEAIVNGISIYPNPVTDNRINLQFTNQPVGNYFMHLYNTDGALIHITEVSIAASNQIKEVRLPSGLAKGNYVVKIMSMDDAETTFNILVQ